MPETRAPSGELFVRVNAATICGAGGSLDGTVPFLLRELLPSSADSYSSATKLALAKQQRQLAKVR